MAFQRLLPLVVLLLLVAPPSSAVPSLHPVVLVPGNTCSQLEARLTDEYEPPPASGCGVPRQGRGWFRLWENLTALQLQEDPPSSGATRTSCGLSTTHAPATTVTCRASSWPSAPPAASASTTLPERMWAWKGSWRHCNASDTERERTYSAPRTTSGTRRPLPDWLPGPSLTGLQPQAPGGARKPKEREQAGRPRDAQPGRPLRHSVPGSDTPAVAQEVRQAPRHALPRRRRLAAQHVAPRLQGAGLQPHVAAGRRADLREQELRKHLLGPAVPQGVRPHVPGDHAGQQLLCPRHARVPRGSRFLRGRRGAVPNEGAAGDAQPSGAARADDGHQWYWRAHRG